MGLQLRPCTSVGCEDVRHDRDALERDRERLREALEAVWATSNSPNELRVVAAALGRRTGPHGNNPDRWNFCCDYEP